MASTPVALYPFNMNHEASKIKQELFKLWETFFFGSGLIKPDDEKNPTFLRHIVLDSWERCKAYSLDPRIPGSTRNLSDADVKALKKGDEVYHLARPILNHLDRELSFTKHTILFCNKDGIILDCLGDPDVTRTIGDSVNAVVGSDWREEWAGTNAIGTSLVLKKPVQLFSTEHFSEGCHRWACSSAPVTDPFSGEVLGVLNLSTESELVKEQSLLMALWGAQEIERQFTQLYFEVQKWLQNVYLEHLTKRNHGDVIVCNWQGKPLWMRTTWPYDMLTSILAKEFEHYRHQSERQITTTHRMDGNAYRLQCEKLFRQDRPVGWLVMMEKLQVQTPGKANPPKIKAKYRFSDLIGESAAFEQALKMAKMAAACDSNVLITGQSGTGKELIANAIHMASERADCPFIAINCGALPKDLLPSELFGYVGGAFTGANAKGHTGKFQLADGGTLFLDELGEMPVELQVQLLRAIQEQEIIPVGGTSPIPVNVRIIVTTNRVLEKEIEQGRFRQDLYYRVNVVHIEMPSLREREGDIQLLSRHFLDKYAVKKKNGPYSLTDDAMEILKGYHWPGNIRELQNAIEYAVNCSANGVITPRELPRTIMRRTMIVESADMTPVEMAERAWLLDVLKQTEHNISKASKLLNMDRSSLYRKLKKYGLDIKQLKNQTAI